MRGKNAHEPTLKNEGWGTRKIPRGPARKTTGTPGYNLKDDAASVGLGGGDATETAAPLRGRASGIGRSGRAAAACGVADGGAVDDQLDAAVALTAVGCVIGSHRLGLAESLGAHRGCGNAFLGKIVPDSQ